MFHLFILKKIISCHLQNVPIARSQTSYKWHYLINSLHLICQEEFLVHVLFFSELWSCPLIIVIFLQLIPISTQNVHSNSLISLEASTQRPSSQVSWGSSVSFFLLCFWVIPRNVLTRRKNLPQWMKRLHATDTSVHHLSFFPHEWILYWFLLERQRLLLKNYKLWGWWKKRLLNNKGREIKKEFWILLTSFFSTSPPASKL